MPENHRIGRKFTIGGAAKVRGSGQRLVVLLACAGILGLLWIPTGLGSSTRWTLTAPYSGSLVSHTYLSLSRPRCTTVTVPVPAGFNLSTGTGSGIVATSTTACGVPAGSDVWVYQWLRLSSATFSVPTAASYSIRADWKVSYSATLNVSNVSAGSTAFARYAITVEDGLFTVGPNTTANDSGTIVAFQSLLFRNANVVTHSTNQTNDSMVVSLTPGNVYRVFAYLVVYTECFAFRGTGAHALSLVNWGTHGNYADLESLSIR